VFEGEFTHPKVIFQLASDQLEFHRKVTQGVKGKTSGAKKQDIEKWKPPPRGIVKLNWDAAIDSKTKRMGVGVVVRDHFSGVVAT
jgi:hypothetical protein